MVLAYFLYCRPHIYYVRLGRMSHPDPHGPPDRTPIKVGEIWDNPAGRATAELTALVGARVVGEHRHPALASGAIHRTGGRVDREAQQADQYSASRRDSRHHSRRMARLVECGYSRRAGTGGDHTRRAVRAHD